VLTGVTAGVALYNKKKEEQAAVDEKTEATK